MSASHSHSHLDRVLHQRCLNTRRIFWALLLIGSFVIVEIIGGIVSGSLALLADAAHMLVDTVALFLAWLAFKLSTRPADKVRSYGYHRFPILAAFTNGISLFFIICWVMYEAVDRLLNPQEVLGGTMLVIASLGLVINIIAFIILHGADPKNLNIRGAKVHVLGDMLASIATIIAALVISFFGWTPIDPLLSVFIGFIVLYSAWFIIKDSAHVLLEGVPTQLDVQDIRQDLVSNIDVVEDVHHVHAWSLTQDLSLLTLHAKIPEDANPDSVTAKIQNHLSHAFNINHVTVQIELEHCTDDAMTVSY